MREYLRWKDDCPLWTAPGKMPVLFARGVEYLIRTRGKNPQGSSTPSGGHQKVVDKLLRMRVEQEGLLPNGEWLQR